MDPKPSFYIRNYPFYSEGVESEKIHGIMDVVWKHCKSWLETHLIHLIQNSTIDQPLQPDNQLDLSKATDTS